jgi:glycosyltransferase involved in cell wall biosynthesis
MNKEVALEDMAKIRRALITNHFPLEGSGSGTYAKEIALALKKMGIDVKVLVVGSPETKADLDVESIGYEDGSFPAFTTHEQQTRPLKFNDMSTEEVDQYVKLWREALDRTINSFDPDAVHLGHAWVAAGIAPSVFKRRIPIVTTVHGTDIKGVMADPNGKLTQLARVGHQEADGIIAISKHIQDEAHEKLGIPLDKLTIQLNGFNPQKFEYNPSIKRDEVLAKHGLEELHDAVIVYTSGKFADFKRHDRTVGAVALASKEIPNIHLIHLGGGDEKIKQELVAQAENLGISDRVHFLGNQPQETLNEFANISDIAAFLSENEPFGLVALEAQATGTPVITTNSGGFPDFVNDEVGRIVEPDEQVIAQALVKEIKANSKKTKGPVAVKHAQDLTWDSHIKPIVEIWEKNS